jgi:hypothetical protein
MIASISVISVSTEGSSFRHVARDRLVGPRDDRHARPVQGLNRFSTRGTRTATFWGLRVPLRHTLLCQRAREWLMCEPISTAMRVFHLEYSV